MIQELETPRLRLRHFERTDLERFADINCDSEVRRFMWDGVLDRDQAEQEIKRILAAYRAETWDYLAVELRKTGALIGHCGVFLADGGRTGSLAYLLDKPFWDCGYTTEAITALIDHTLQIHPIERLVAVTPTEHAASRRIMEKLGMSFDSNGTRKGMNVVIYATTRDDYLNRSNSPG